MVVGIDLGTTNSLVSVFRNGNVELIPNEFGEFLTPSVISFDGEKVIVGKAAKERLITHPDTTIAEFKRQMGRDIKYELGKGNFYTPVKLSSIIIKKLVEDAEKYLGEKVESAVISVPAYFDDHQREATRLAGVGAGITVTQLVNEPSAAALSYHYEHIDQDEKFIVFDFGGGTLDVTVVDAFENMVEIANISGDNCLGGKDFNEVIAMDMCRNFGFEWKLISAKNKAILIKNGESIKISLSESNSIDTKVNLEGKEYEYSLTQQGLINISSPIFRKLTIILKKLMNDAMLSQDDIDSVIMVGGSSKMPIVRAYLESLFPGKIRVDIDGDSAICKGTGVATGISLRMDKVKDIVMTDICPFSLGTDVVGDKMSVIIPKNQTLPVSIQRRYYTAHSMQNRLEFKIFQGEKLKASSNLLLDTITFDIPPKPQGEVYADVRFSYDLNGIFDIDIYCPANGKEVHRKRGAAEGSDEISLKQLQLRMDELKQDPREIPEIQFLLQKAERMYEEGNVNQRSFLEDEILAFNAFLDKASVIECKKASVIFSMKLDQIEKNMFSFKTETTDLWKEYFEDMDDKD
ncbi:MAG: Hsp70 family protein [Butyrivibrio sp.]|nr:Hsp70 family protein [Butyrivibrio sp.]